MSVSVAAPDRLVRKAEPSPCIASASCVYLWQKDAVFSSVQSGTPTCH